MYRFDIKEIDKEEALQMIRQYHYSNTLPKLNKYFLGFFLRDELVGVVTLGWGTRPRHTIQRMFPSLDTKDYLEIGRMCMKDEMPRNSESQMLSQLVKWMKINLPEIKVLFTWADGMVGKVGYVYQASNFIYAGYSGGEMYMKDGVKLHVRQMKSFLVQSGVKDDRITVRPTLEQMRKYNIQHFKGKQYRYLLFLCDKKEKKRLLEECLIDLTLPRPKDDDLSWTVKDRSTGKWVESKKPPYITDVDQHTKGIVGQMN
ncbi:Mom family adenine methylcarbamoylation protein [Coprococcus phoceensis]|uniref:Mom family adenine methylcarbamoylation protein n=1 Tax=Coprococcus phoceensis TaxID=1870993 RepID=UPI0035651313